MKKLAILLALSIALPLAGLKDKDKTKHKEKSFEPVSVTAAQAAGRYVGIVPDVVLDLTATGGTFRDFDRTATLTGVVLDGSVLHATAAYADGTTRPLEVQFVNRLKNGETTFGLMLRNVDIPLDGDVTLQDLFCARQ